MEAYIVDIHYGGLMIPFECIHQWNIVCLFRGIHETEIVLNFLNAEISMPYKLADIWIAYAINYYMPFHLDVRNFTVNSFKIKQD